MDAIQFLLDEHLPEYLADELIRLEPTIDIIAIGDYPRPARGTKDPELLIHCEEKELALLTLDKSTIPPYLRAHYNAGRHTWGVVFVRSGFGVQTIAQELLFLWSSMQKEEWRDFSIFVPR